MAIIKNKLKDNYTMIPNAIIQDKELSNNAFRLLVYLWSKPSNWEVNQKNIAKEFDVHISSIKKWIKELKNCGYLYVLKRNVGQSFEYVYELVHEGHYSVPREINEGHSHEGHFTKDTLTNGANLVLHNKTDSNKTECNNTELNKTKDFYFENPLINELFINFLENRIELFGKKINTKHSINLLVNKLNKYDDETKEQMINNSLENSWKGIFEIKQNNFKFKQRTIGSTKDWNIVKEKELTDEEKREMKDIIKKMKGNS